MRRGNGILMVVALSLIVVILPGRVFQRSSTPPPDSDVAGPVCEAHGFIHAKAELSQGAVLAHGVTPFTVRLSCEDSLDERDRNRRFGLTRKRPIILLFLEPGVRFVNVIGSDYSITAAHVEIPSRSLLPAEDGILYIELEAEPAVSEVERSISMPIVRILMVREPNSDAASHRDADSIALRLGARLTSDEEWARESRNNNIIEEANRARAREESNGDLNDSPPHGQDRAAPAAEGNP